MSKNVLIISGSPRKGGNSDMLCREFASGAVDGGNEVTKIDLADKKIGYCKACYYCKRHKGECVIKDDMGYILDLMQKANVIVLSTPVYFYSLSAQLKTFIDRCVAQWTKICDKEFYFIMTSADDTDTVMVCTLACLRGFISCLSDCREMGVIYGKGVYEKGEIFSKCTLFETYEIGKNV